MKNLEEIKFSDYELNDSFFSELYKEQKRDNKRKLEKIYKKYCYLRLYYDIFPFEKKYDRPIINLIGEKITDPFDIEILAKMNNLEKIIDCVNYSEELRKKYNLDIDLEQLDDVKHGNPVKFYLKKASLFGDIKRKLKFLNADLDKKKSMLSRDTELYFLLDDNLKRNDQIIDVLLKNAKYRKNNYGEVLKYVSDEKQKTELKKLCKINGYCDLYFFARNIDPSKPLSIKLDDVGKEMMKKNLFLFDDKYKICLLCDEFFNHIDDEHRKLIERIFGIKTGKKIALSDVLKGSKFTEEETKKVIKRDFLKAIKKTILSNNRGIHRISSISAAAMALIVGITLPANINALRDVFDNDIFSNNKSNSREYNGTIPSSLEASLFSKGYLYSNHNSKNNIEFIVINKFDKDFETKISEAKKSNKSIGLILRPTGNLDEFINSIGMISYYIHKYSIDLPILYDVSSVSDMENSCRFAKKILGKLDLMGCYSGLYGDLSSLKEFDKLSNGILSTSDYDRMVNVSSEEDLLEIPKNYNNMVNYYGNAYFKYDLIDIISSNNLNSWNRAVNALKSLDGQSVDELGEIIKKNNFSLETLYQINDVKNINELAEKDKIFLPIVDEVEYDNNNVNIKNDSSNQVYVKGIDISEFNWDNDCDWDEVKKQGVEFAIIRIADYASDNHADDAKLSQNIKGCSEQNFPVGFYYLPCPRYYSNAASIKEAMIDESKCIINKLVNHGINKGFVFMDIEQAFQDYYFNVDRYELNDSLTEVKSLFENNGYNLGFYCSDILAKHLNNTVLADQDNIFWVTQHESYDYGVVRDENYNIVYNEYGEKYCTPDSLIDFKNFGNGVTDMNDKNYDNDNHPNNPFYGDIDGDGDMDLDDKVYDTGNNCDYKRDEVKLIQFCEYAKLNCNGIEHVDLDVARKDFIEDKFYTYSN